MSRGGCWRLEVVGTSMEVVGCGQRRLLAVVAKSMGGRRWCSEVENESLSHWKDAEICLEKARALFEYFAEMMHTEGIICEERGQIHEALAAYINALLLEPGYVPCKVLIGAVLSKMGSKVLLVARSILSDALRIQPTNHMSWYYLGLVHRDDGRIGHYVTAVRILPCSSMDMEGFRDAVIRFSFQ
ncbi:hypothetical protein ACSBR2_005870 [Camellia fascicularis]